MTTAKSILKAGLGIVLLIIGLFGLIGSIVEYGEDAVATIVLTLFTFAGLYLLLREEPKEKEEEIHLSHLPPPP